MKKAIALAFLFLLGSPSLLFAQVGTAFTYQGRLVDGAGPANGTYDLQFKLFDAVTAGAQVGSTVTRAGVAVSAGLFTVSLDFGAQFTGSRRWLEVGVKAPAAGAYAVLAPRQELTPSPNAIHAAVAGMALSEADPRVGLTSAGNWCVGSGSQVTCTQPAPVMTETDPQVGVITSGRACVGNNTGGIDCGSGTVTGDLVITGNYGYSTARTRYLSISPAAFFPESDTVGYATFSGPFRRLLTSPGVHTLAAEVLLPGNATIKEWSCKVFDFSPTYNLTVSMFYTNYASLLETLMWGSFSSTGSSGAELITSGTRTFPVDPDNLYQLRVSWDGACTSGCQLYGCQIRYEVSTAY